jgi:hypothetical protein
MPEDTNALRNLRKEVLHKQLYLWVVRLGTVDSDRLSRALLEGGHVQ